MLARTTAFGIITLVLLTACGESSTETSSSTTPADAGIAEGAPARSDLEAMLHQHVAILASDEYEGRAPATAGEEKTINYLRRQFQDLGIAPGNGDSYFQPVEVTEITTRGEPALSIQGSDYQATLAYGEQQVVGTTQQIPFVTVQGSEMVFVGYGIVAPERGWNDYAGIDVTDKTVVILVNDPGYATQDPELFNGNAMTYYGRWTYKYEEAARQGAAAAIIVHETGPAGYGWEVV
ncbi:MAG: peptidase M28, partial [Proteobacteria bacterium]|nr:peptidase M28 [Pseudomonadota bacterium]